MAAPGRSSRIVSVLEHSLRPSAGWLRGIGFDLWFCGGLAGIALASGLVLALDPSLYPIVVLVDFWVLGYQHVAATFTRLCFDGESFARHRFLLIQLPAF